ncbi:hypothetical protein [Larkinella soli]|uniref:hypothetical protein n=1 Tax=Larkinella soli TaxID=1770527 RepID=UPI000FFB8F62|nr:hypothetical protein [Larkinella soli]
MKTFISSLLVALSVSASTVALANVDGEKVSGSYQVGMYASSEAAKLNVMVAKEKGTQVSVQLLGENGQVLAIQRLSKHDTSVRTRFDLSELEDGKYTVVVTDGSSKTVKEVNLQTKRPVQPERFISVR